MSFDNNCHELPANDNTEDVDTAQITVYETVREEFIRPQEQTSIFDDNVEDILEMNAAIAMLTNNDMNDPLATEKEAGQEEKQKHALHQEDLEQTTTAVLAKLHQEQDDNVLYDSDGNPIEIYEWHDEVSEDVQTPALVKNDTELPIRMGYFNMNRYILENGLTKNIIIEQKEAEEEILGSKEPNLKKLKADRTVDSLSYSISQGVSFSKFEQLDSDEDILEVVEISNVRKRVVPPKVAKHKEILRLAQEQAKKRRIEDQDYIAYRIAEQKRKKQLRREAKLAKEAGEDKIVSSQNNEISPLKRFKKLTKKSDESPDKPLEIQNQPMSEADLHDILEDKEVDANIEEMGGVDCEQNSEEVSQAELPSSQVAFRTFEHEENNSEGIINELNSQSEESASLLDSKSGEEIEQVESQSDETTYVSELEDNASQNQDDQSALFIKDSFKMRQNNLASLEEGGDVLNFLSGQFNIPEADNVEKCGKLNLGSPDKSISQSDVIGLLSGQFHMPQEDTDDHSKRDKIGNQAKELPENDNEDISKDNHTESCSSDSEKNEGFYSETEDTGANKPQTPEEVPLSVPQALKPLRNVHDLLMNKDSFKKALNSGKISMPSFKNAFVEEEADVEEDEYMNFGGVDGEIEARLDRYEPEFVAEADKEVVDNYDDVIDLHRKQMQHKHEADVSKLLHDVTTGNLRKRSQRGDANGKGLDTDSDEENDLLLRKIRKKSAPAFMLDDIDDSEMTPLQKIAADPRSLAFAKCFVREENDFEGCISSDDEMGDSHRQNANLDDGLEKGDRASEDSESYDSENSCAENEESCKLQNTDIKSKLVSSDDEKSESCMQENIRESKQAEEDLNDPNFYHTTLSSERLGLDIFGIVKERRLRVQNSKRNKVQESELYKYANKRTIESTRISQKQSLAVYAKKEASRENHAIVSKQTVPKTKKKTFQAFQIGASHNEIVRIKESKPEKKVAKKNIKIDQGQSNANILSLLTRKF